MSYGDLRDIARDLEKELETVPFVARLTRVAMAMGYGTLFETPLTLRFISFLSEGFPAASTHLAVLPRPHSALL
jgi:hypothetical protein